MVNIHIKKQNLMYGDIERLDFLYDSWKNNVSIVGRRAWGPKQGTNDLAWATIKEKNYESTEAFLNLKRDKEAWFLGDYFI